MSRLPNMKDAQPCGICKLVWSFRIPFTSFQVEIVRVLLADALPDEVRKELTLMGFFDESGDKK